MQDARNNPEKYRLSPYAPYNMEIIREQQADVHSEEKQLVTDAIARNAVSNIRIANVDPKDYPDFCDAYIESANITLANGKMREMTESELEILGESDFGMDYVSENAFEELITN